MRRQSRLFAIAEVLRGRRSGVTAEALAERFGVTVRTIYRDLDALRDAALPVRADRGRGGGYALEKSYSLPPVNFTAREAALLITVGRWAGELRLVRQECMATVGAVSNPDNSNQNFGKAGRMRLKGFRPKVRGVVMNPIDHPHGGGEGRTSGGRHPVSPWGKPTKGARTRTNKATGKLILRSRHLKKAKR